MKYTPSVLSVVAAILAVSSLLAQPAQNANVPKIRFESVPDFLKYSPDMNLGEVLGVAINSKGTLAVLNHPGSATVGPLYGNASTQIFEFDANGKFVREVGKGVYGLGYGHGIRYDKYDNLWIVDKGTHAVTRFNPAGYVTLNLGRRPEGPDEPEYFKGGRGGGPPPVPIDGYFRGPTDVAWDSDDNIYISDGYTNSRFVKLSKDGTWVKAIGTHGNGPDQFSTPHGIASDGQLVYVADRGNNRIQIYDGASMTFKTSFTGVGAPWSVQVTPKYVYSGDGTGKIYRPDKSTGKLLGWIQTGMGQGQTGCIIHEIHAVSDNQLIKGSCSEWNVEKITFKGTSATQ
jgi:DNA-binding beta-propeller fold protein YncE